LVWNAFVTPGKSGSGSIYHSQGLIYDIDIGNEPDTKIQKRSAPKTNLRCAIRLQKSLDILPFIAFIFVTFSYVVQLTW